MKKLIVILLNLFVLISVSQASVLNGKKIYAAKLHKECGFTGEVMGKKYTAEQWKKLYERKLLSQTLKKECPLSNLITDEKELNSLASFFVMFAKDSGNTASCDK